MAVGRPECVKAGESVKFNRTEGPGSLLFCMVAKKKILHVNYHMISKQRGYV